MDIKERIMGSLYGIATGDALGAPYEAHRPKDINTRFGTVKDMQDLGIWGLGEFTDDTWLTLATARAYDGEVFNPKKAADSMVIWANVNGKGMGRITGVALGNLRSGREDLYKSGHKALASAGGQGAGNGSLMRCASTGLAYTSSYMDLIANESALLSEITHADSRCVAACVGYNIVLAGIVEDKDYKESLKLASVYVRSINEEVSGIFSRVSNGAAHGWDVTNLSKMGFVNRALDRALVAFYDATYKGGTLEDHIVQIVNEGGDCDTNAAIAGGLLGAKFGYSNIPQRWIRDIMEKEELNEATALLIKFRER